MVEQVRRAGISVYWMLCIMGLFAILSSTMSKNPVLKLYATSLGTPTSLMGIIASASTIPGMLISLPAASLSDIFGRRKVLLASTLIFATAPFTYLLVTQWWHLAIVRFYHGFATAIFMPVAEATIAEIFPAKRGERISLFNSATYLGRGAAPFLGGYILSMTYYSYHTLYIAVGIAGATAFTITLLFLAEGKRAPNQQPSGGGAKGTAIKMFRGWYQVTQSKGVLIVSLVQAAQYYAYGAAEFFLVGYLNDVVGLDPFSIGIVTGSQVVALVVARPFMGRISDRVGRRTPILLGSIISCLLLPLFPLSTQLPILILISVGYGLGFAMAIASTSPLISELVPKELVGTSMGFISTMMDVGQTLGPIASGIVLATSLQYVGLFTSLSIILAASSAIFILARIQRKPA